MQNKLILTLMSLVMLAVAGCSEVSLRDDFGRSTKTNRSMQTLNPSAKQMQVPAATLDGQKAEKVVKEYRQEKAKAPTEVMTQ
jgi:type IV pilus biogenesis protein CpaD/CtpE